MKVLITTDLYKPFVNGVITSLCALADELIEIGHDVKIITLSNSRYSYAEGNVTYLGSIDMDKIYPGAKLKISFISKELRDIYYWKPDIVHTQCEFSTFPVGKRIARKFNIPLIHTYHTIYEDYTHYFLSNIRIGHYIASRFSSHVVNQCDNVIAPTEKVKSLLNSYDINTPISVIPTGIRLNKFFKNEVKNITKEIKRKYGINENNFVIGFIGRIAKEKNLDELFDFIEKIKEDNITLLIVGDGPYRETLEERSKKINKQIVFTSMVEPEMIQNYYKTCNLFMSLSSSETQGLTYIEALASSIPLLCKKDDCLDSVIEQGKNGWQFIDLDQAYSFFKEFYNNENLQNEMSHNAKIIAEENFSSTAFAENVLDLYNFLIERKNKSYKFA